MKTGVVLTAFALVSILGPLFAGPVEAGEAGICAITAGMSNGQYYATLKCAKKTRPDYFVIRSTVLERDDKEGYLELAKYSGSRFACTLTKGRTKRSYARRLITTEYELSECR
jgi:hypothetical protein